MIVHCLQMERELTAMSSFPYDPLRIIRDHMFLDVVMLPETGSLLPEKAVLFESLFHSIYR